MLLPSLSYPFSLILALFLPLPALQVPSLSCAFYNNFQNRFHQYHFPFSTLEDKILNRVSHSALI